jgi:hypothetical protein
LTSGSHLSATAVRVGPADKGPPVSGSVALRRTPIGCRGRRCPNAPGGLKAVPTAPSCAAARTHCPTSPVPTGRLSRQRRCPSRCRFTSSSRSPPSPGLSHCRRVRSRRRRCLHHPCASECGRAVASLVPPSALIFSHVPVGRRRSLSSHRAADAGVHARLVTRRRRLRRRAAPPSTRR